MDPVSLVSGFGTLRQLAPFISTRKHTFEGQKESVWSGTTLSSCFLKVLDLPLSGERGTCVAETTSLEDLRSTLESVPLLGPNTIRVYVEDLPDGVLLASHLKSTLEPYGVSIDYMSRFKKSVPLSDRRLAALVECLPNLFAQWKGPPCWLRTRNILPLFSIDKALPRIHAILKTFSGNTLVPHNIDSTLGLCTISLDEGRTIRE